MQANRSRLKARAWGGAALSVGLWSGVRGPCLALLWGLVLLGPARQASADSVVLKNGTRFLGVITHNGTDGVSIRSGGNNLAFGRQDVASVQVDHATRSHERAAPSTVRHEEKATAVAALNQEARVILYGTGWCGYCELARAWFREHQIPFLDRDLDQDPEALPEVRRKCSEAGTRFSGEIPVIDVHGSIIPGFDIRRIEAALKSAG